ncbi:MAG: hypothetical protein AB7K41_15865, partial [Bdellovibrionales bacterium]
RKYQHTRPTISTLAEDMKKDIALLFEIKTGQISVRDRGNYSSLAELIQEFEQRVRWFALNWPLFIKKEKLSLEDSPPEPLTWWQKLRGLKQ